MLSVIIAIAIFSSVPGEEVNVSETPLDTTSLLTLCEQAKKDARQCIGVPGFRLVLFAYDIDFEPPRTRVHGLSEIHTRAYCDCYRTEAKEILRTYRIGDSVLCCLSGVLAYILLTSSRTD